MSILVSAGRATYRDLRDDLSLDEVAELLEILLVERENERRAHDHAKQAAERRKS